jgi:hypothetical protein
MKKLIAVLVVVLCSVAWAAVNLTLTVPDQYTVQVLAAMNTLADTHMTLVSVGSSEDHIDFHGKWDFRIAAKDPNETNKQFAQRFTQELVRASVRLVKAQQERERYEADVAALTPPDVNVPDDVIQ